MVYSQKRRTTVPVESTLIALTMEVALEVQGSLPHELLISECPQEKSNPGIFPVIDVLQGHSHSQSLWELRAVVSYDGQNLVVLGNVFKGRHWCKPLETGAVTAQRAALLSEEFL